MGKSQGRANRSSASPRGVFVTTVMLVGIVSMALLLLSNQKGVSRRAAEVESAQRDLILLSEELQHLSEQEDSRASTLIEQERLVRERLHWTAPGEFILRIKER
jgi:hypothetical protein